MLDLLRWDHSLHVLEKEGAFSVVAVGGFGNSAERKGMGRTNSVAARTLTDHWSDSAWEFVPVTGDLPCPRMQHAADNFTASSVLMFGGRTNPATFLNDLFLFDFITSSWTKIEPQNSDCVPAKRARHSFTKVSDHEFLVFGGCDAEIVHGDFFLFDYNSYSWKELSFIGEVPSPRYSHSVNYDPVSNCVFIYGGKVTSDCSTISEDPSIYKLSLDSLVCEKIRSVWSPSSRFSHSSVMIGDKIVYIGGITQGEWNINEIVGFDIRTCQWISGPSKEDGIPDLDFILTRHQSVIFKEQVIIVGGGAACFSFGSQFNKALCL